MGSLDNLEVVDPESSNVWIIRVPKPKDLFPQVAGVRWNSILNETELPCWPCLENPRGVLMEFKFVPCSSAVKWFVTARVGPRLPRA